ncbi:MAG: alpha/beta hydrolase family protein [Promethearchaeati archaeon]
MEKKSEKKSKIYKIVIVSFIFVISLLFLYINRSYSYNYYERIEFESAGAKLYANLYYPSNDLEFQDKHPLVIFAHAFQSQRDFDLRAPVELTKRGFFVASIDYQGHGESGGNLFNIGDNNLPGLAQDCSNLLDKLETLTIYKNEINSSQIGLIGHSLGGMVVLMNDALDPRFNATVTWAGLVDLDLGGFGISEDSIFNDYIPINLINESNVQNLLIIHHINDPVLPFEDNALAAQALTNGTLIQVTTPMFGMEHLIVSTSLEINTINFFEAIFFNSEDINGPISVSYYLNYLFLFINLFLLFLTSMYLARYFSSFFNLRPMKDTYFIKNEIIEKDNKKTALRIIGYFLIFIFTYLFFTIALGVFALLIGSLILMFSFILFRLMTLYDNTESKKTFLSTLRTSILSQFKLNSIGFSMLSAIFFIGFYLIFSISYPFAFFFPTKLSDFLLALTAFPLYVNLEIFYREIIYPELKIINSKKRRIAIMIGLSAVMQSIIFGITLSWILVPGFVATNLVMFVVSVKNTYLYEDTKNFLSTLISSFIIIQIFFGATISSVYGLGQGLSYFLSLT